MTMNPQLVNNALRVLGTGLVALGHVGIVPQPWAQIVGEIGAALLLLTKTKPGDIKPSELTPAVLESVRPTKPSDS
jgi:hypothetical protein